MSEHKTMIEVNGIKLDVDLRTAKRVDHLSVGDRVKVLVKQYSDYAVYPGTIIGFEPFSALPTIIIAYLVADYSSAGIKFLHFNANTKETEVIKAIDDDCIDINKENILQQFDNDIQKKQREIDEVLARKKYFIDNFKSYWQFETLQKPSEVRS